MITGIMPKILSDKLRPSDIYVVSKGTDIDITIDDGNSETTLSAITLGNGKWEISELDDNSALFREYNEGDVISLDTLTKILKPLVSSKENDCCGNQIFSFNLLGKIKYGLQDKGREIERRKQERKDRFSKKVKGITDWFTDDIDNETATAFLRKSYPGAKVGKLEKYNDIDGANFKVLFGVPSEKKFYVGVLHRNGNDIRLLDDSYDAETPLRSFKDQDKCLEFYENYPYGKKEDDGSEQQENNTENENNAENNTENENNAENNVADDFDGGSDYMKGETGESDGVEWEITQSFKRFIKSNLDQSKLLSKENEILDDCFNECEFTKSNMAISDDVCLDRFASKVFRIHGGLNGSGNWSDYFEELQRLTDILTGKLNEQFEDGCKVYLINLIVDVADDVWDAVFGISVDEKYDETKINSEKYTGEDENIDFNYNNETDEWYPYLIPSSIAKKRKKSKYNGKNVTGYEDGMLGEMAVASSRHLFSKALLKSSFEIEI